ncbi:MAG: PspC domain-containing protein [Firmicutes bacterium]|nr:PspC domain-containing protein [Bacillota bacterium]
MSRLYRSRKNRIIGGVAGGLAEYFRVDVALIRLLWVVASFLGGGGILAYIIAWIVIPEENPFASSPEETMGSIKRQRSAGLLLIGLGIIFLANELIGSFIYYFWPLLIIAAGIFLIWRSAKGAGE